MENKRGGLIFAGILVVLLLGMVSAAGVATPYWDGNPLLLSSGQSDTVHLNLQNTGNESMILNATITSSSNIATLKKTLYTVNSGQTDVDVPVEVSVPKDARLNGTYLVTISFKQVSEGTGMVHVASAFTTSFPVEIVPEEQSVLYNNSGSQGLQSWIVILIVLGILVLLFVLTKVLKKGKKSRK